MKIKKLQYGTEGIEVYIEGYDDRFIPCFEIDDIADGNDFIAKIKAKLIELDNLPPLPPADTIPQKFLDLKNELEGKEI